MAVSLMLEMLLALQAAPATVTGTVRDAATSRPIEGAVVSLTDAGRQSVTDTDGRYILRDVAPGPQHVTVRVIGYAERALHAIVPRTGSLEISFALDAEPIRLEPIEVHRAVSARLTDDTRTESFADRSLSNGDVRNHPLLAEPDVLEALRGGVVTLMPESPAGLHVRGGAADQVAYYVDGIPILGPYHAAGLFGALDPDAIARIRLESMLPSPSHGDVLSGVVLATTIDPATRIRGAASLSNMQARATIDGPLGHGGAGWLLGWRNGLPGAFAARGESSYLDGETGDLLARIRLRIAGGWLHALAYDNENELAAAASAEPAARRNAFGWQSRSFGADWSGPVGLATLRVLVWSASAAADAAWFPAGGSPIVLDSWRRDDGLSVSVERRQGAARTLAGARFTGMRTSLRVDSAFDESLHRRAATPVAAVFVEHERPLQLHVTVLGAAAIATAAGTVHASPRLGVRWTPAGRPFSVTGSIARLHQFAQSVRNPESVASNIFPADLWVGAGRDIPAARSDVAGIALEYRPLPGLRIGMESHTRKSSGIVLAAPRTGLPFATHEVAIGNAAARGIGIDATFSAARYGATASWSWQRVRYVYGDSSFVPAHASRHDAQAGLIVFPTSTSSVRIGVTGIFGRRTTGLRGAFEWESCNLLDGGCEFVGTPDHAGEALGGRNLPAYLRIDIGARKHWHIETAGRITTVALFGTVTNVLGRRNVLTWAIDPATGERSGIEMRPRAPLVLGLDWSF